MLEQEKELTATSRILEETWERLLTLVDTYKEQVRGQLEEVAVSPYLLGILRNSETGQSVKINFAFFNFQPAKEPDSEEKSKDVYQPSFVYSVLAAVSGTVPQVTETI